MEALGSIFDLAIGLAPGDLQGGRTGARVCLQDAEAVTFVVVKAAGTAGDDPSYVLKQHTAASGGTTANLPVIDHYYLKASVAALPTATWRKVTQAASATLADPGALTTSAEEQQIMVVEVGAPQLGDGFGWVSLDATDPPNANAQLAASIVIVHGLRSMRSPELLTDTQTGY